IGMVLAGRILGNPLKQRFTGVDLVKSLCERVAEKPITVGFLGGRGNVAEKAAECLVAENPELKVSFIGEEWSNDGFVRAKKIMNHESRSMNQGKDKKDHNSSFIIHDSNFIDILFVAFGAPKQEFWIDNNLEKLPVKVAIGVGGAFDYISGKVPRAPKLIRNIGFEWLFRLIAQPWRIKRQLSLLEFSWLVVKEKFKQL
ncbi:MAG: WecB/TagA/CpsF family glycosyltransferase, partial [Candidatus Curtissbacteria bacterium]|nr:WecB/TagA/CpsF family glycosyltransferase [Candidatus Curtissbacteria bacterium]